MLDVFEVLLYMIIKIISLEKKICGMKGLKKWFKIKVSGKIKKYNYYFFLLFVCILNIYYFIIIFLIKKKINDNILI